MSMERISEFFVRYRVAVIAVVFLSVAASGVAFWFDNHNKQALVLSGDSIYSALQHGDSPIIPGLKKVIEESKGVAVNLAEFRLAMQYVKDKDLAAARKLYFSLAEDKRLSRELRELAEYFGAIVALSEGDLGEDIEQRLIRLATSKGAVYKSSAKEALIFMKLKKDDISGAVLIMKEVLGDPMANSEIKRNVESLIRVYGNK